MDVIETAQRNRLGSARWMIARHRIARVMAVGRFLIPAALLGAMSAWHSMTQAFVAIQAGTPGVAGWSLALLYSLGLTLISLLDARSRLQDYKRAKDLFYENGFNPRIPRIFIHSRCQRDAVRTAARDLGLADELDRYYHDLGYRWYHILPDFVFRRPAVIFSVRYWQKTLFEPAYTSLYFFW